MPGVYEVNTEVKDVYFQDLTYLLVGLHQLRLLGKFEVWY